MVKYFPLSGLDHHAYSKARANPITPAGVSGRDFARRGEARQVHARSDFRKRTVPKDTFDAELHGKPAAKRHQKPFASPEFQTRSGPMHGTPEGPVDRS